MRTLLLYLHQSEALRRVQAPYTIKVTFCPLTSLRRVLSHPKDLIPLLYQSGVVYRIGCLVCDACYIGQTCRTLIQRRKEHRRAVDNRDCQSSASAEHSSLPGMVSPFSGVILTCDSAVSLSLDTSISIADIQEHGLLRHSTSNCSFAALPRGRREAGLNILQVRSHAWNEHCIPFLLPLSLS